MAGRAATAVKSKAKSAPRTSASSKAEKATTTKAAVTKTAVTKAVPAPKGRKKAKAETRTRIYWAVFDQNLKRVAVFEFDQKGEAEKRVEKLSASGGHHFIQKIKVAV